jgi:hypothetical protein
MLSNRREVKYEGEASYVLQSRVSAECRAERPIASRPKALRSHRERAPVCRRGTPSPYSKLVAPRRQARSRPEGKGV